MFFAVCLAAALIGCGGSKGGEGSTDFGSSDAAIGDLATATLDFAYVAACGNGVLDPSETCDDGNTTASDGCSATCAVESGWLCPTAGAPCFLKPLSCGDGIVTPPETCDDGNTTPGDGCNGTCQLEANSMCPTPGQPCTSSVVCGDGTVEGDEACDTGEKSGTMGCAADCSQVTPGYMCPSMGGACAPATTTCPDGIVESGEGCDDGNTSSGDGCSDTCQVEPRYSCPPTGGKCTLVEYCGNGKVETDIGEACDDHNTTAGDGCSATCQLEPYYACTTAGQPCTSTAVCGDGLVQAAETCDDHNTTDGDGCSATCALEAGYTCPAAGVKCQAAQCGDGVLAGLEQCDDGGNVANDGCSATCQLEPGFACVMSMTSPVYSQCHVTTCGDGVKEGFEQCDKGDLIPFDGCSPSCTVEPTCKSGTCTATCGDGLLFPGEACDDGNLIDGDGCDHTCAIETGFMCPITVQSPPTTLVVPILYRDMLYSGTMFAPSTVDQGHPDFQNVNASNTGLVMGTLGPDNEPVYASSGSGEIESALTFCWWYHEVGCDPTDLKKTNPYDKLVYLDVNGKPTTLTLSQTSTSVYQFGTDRFFPVDNLGWNASAATTQTSQDHDNNYRNFSFTSEVHYPFTYTAANSTTTTGPKFEFTGDDDVWVFINGTLVVDLGGTHSAAYGAYTLTTDNATALGLSDGGMYTIDVFQAEAHTAGSNYNLSLSGFTHAISQCSAICGDGKIVGTELCDLGTTNGVSNNTGAYGGCTSTCTLAPYCGDGTVQTGNEQCDDGKNVATYTGTTRACGPGCTFAPYCGDGVVSNGELCDDGADNGTTGHCSADCTPKNSCGDGTKSGAEQCDDGTRNGTSGDTCLSNCTLRCGDAVIESGETCDDGTAANTGGYGKCTASCTKGPSCGDGIKNGAEQCDNGTAGNTGAYGGCTATCTLAPYCGDGIKNGTEKCDNGASNSVTAYGQGKCTNTCAVAPYCGDGIVQASFGETCDGAACNSTCMGAIVQ